MDTTAELVKELANLHRLTQTEIMIAETRRAQATTEDFERELRENAAKGRERLQLLDDAIRNLGGTPDYVGSVLARLAAPAKAILEQASPFEEALYGDLALEHQLHDRAIFAKVLAQTADLPEVVAVLKRVELAHAATIQWITTRLAEVAMGGPAALRPGPTQVAVGVLQRASIYPTRAFTTGVNRAVASIGELRNRFGSTVDATAERARRLAEATSEVVEAGVSAGLDRAEREADASGADRTAETIHDAREGLGVVNASELPIKSFDNLNNVNAVAAIRRLEDADDVRTVLAYEAAHKNRKSVLQAAQARVEELAAMVAAS
jgi:hypothetical protein